MRSHPAAYQGWIFLLPGILLGCTQSESPRPVQEPRPLEQPSRVEVEVNGLPELGDHLSGLDKGRLEVAPPKGWILASRSKGYVVRFLRSDREQYPMILVTAEDYQGLTEVSPENVDDFARRVKGEESIGGPVEPIAIGRFVGVTYRKRAKEPRSVNRVLERLLVVTVVAGRKYGVELRAREGRLEDAEKCLFAVVNGIRFSDPRAAKDETETEAAVSADESMDPAGEEPEKKGLDDLLN